MKVKDDCGLYLTYKFNGDLFICLDVGACIEGR